MASHRVHAILNVRHGNTEFKLKVVRGSKGEDVAAALSARSGVPASQLVNNRLSIQILCLCALCGGACASRV